MERHYTNTAKNFANELESLGLLESYEFVPSGNGAKMLVSALTHGDYRVLFATEEEHGHEFLTASVYYPEDTGHRDTLTTVVFFTAGNPVEKFMNELNGYL